jgi:hypothetical protein
MKRSALNVFADRELVGLLAGDPELLALADAIAQTKARRSRRSRGFVTARSLIAAVVVAAAAAFALAVPWRSGEHVSLLERASAAVGTGPVIHAVIEDATGSTYVDLASGQATPQVRTVEIWFDSERQLRHTLTSIDGARVDDMLETPTGATTSSGPVYTCAWIRAHPEKARAARVSCDPGTSTQAQPPVLDPALAGFVDGYREALDNGSAKVFGTGSALGEPVTWLDIATADRTSERVAVDPQSGKPIVVLTFHDGVRGWTYRVRSLEALPAGSGDFAEPQASKELTPSGGSVREKEPIEVRDAPAVVPGALFAGPEFHGLPLTKAFRATVVTGYGPDSPVSPTSAPGVEFGYGGDASSQGDSYVWLLEAATPQIAYGWFMPMTAPKPGRMLVTGFGAYLLVNGVYVTIQASDHELLLSAARALRPVSEEKFRAR